MRIAMLMQSYIRVQAKNKQTHTHTKKKTGSDSEMANVTQQ